VRTRWTVLVLASRGIVTGHGIVLGAAAFRSVQSVNGFQQEIRVVPYQAVGNVSGGEVQP
jgi:hypothetical protein